MKHPPVDHDQMAEKQMADRYLLGQLTPEENAWFENHFPTCQTCMAELELAEALQKTVKIDASLPLDSALTQPTLPKRKAAPVWLSLGLAAGLLLGLIFPLLTQQPSVPSLDLGFREYALVAERSSAAQQEQVIFRADDQHVGLRFATPGPNTSYRLVFLNEANQAVLQSKATQTDQTYKLVLLDKDLFAPGIYTLNIETIDANQQVMPFAQYRIQIKHEG